MSPGAFIDWFRSWVHGPYPGMLQLLNELRGRYTLACLSNTNVVHWERLLGMEGFLQAFDRCFFSHELRMIKPSPHIYVRVASDLAHEPATIAFFDDGPENVEAAARSGMSAHLTIGPDSLRRTLKTLGAL